MKKIIYLYLLSFWWISQNVYAGGWIANGIGGDVSSLSESGYSDSEIGIPHERNYFLLKDGEMSVTLGMAWLPEQITETVNLGPISTQQTRTRYESIPGILFSWGLNKDWTWSNYLSLRYNLYSVGRTDLALSFGPAEGGLGYETSSGFYIVPGASLLHSYYLGAGFRFVNRLGISGRYQAKQDNDKANFSFNLVSLNTTLSKTFGDTFTLSVSGLTYAGYRRKILDDLVYKSWKWHMLTANPTFGVSAALGNHAELGLEVTLDHASLYQAGGPKSVLYLETRF